MNSPLQERAAALILLSVVKPLLSGNIDTNCK